MRQALILILLLLVGCVTPPPEMPDTPVVDDSEIDEIRIPTEDSGFNQPTINASNLVSVGSWNLQIYGKSKSEKEQVMRYIREILTKFDIVAIQEIRDASGDSITFLENYIDAYGEDYGMAVSPRLGNTSSKEQYAFLYKTSRVRLLGHEVYDDVGNKFHRPPHIGYFQAGQFDFTLINVHTDPDVATSEIYDLWHVANWSLMRQGEQDIIILGDLNADCTYYNTNREDALSEYIWTIDDDADTNLASSTCAYDRIIIANATYDDWWGESFVYEFDETFKLDDDMAKQISDHYPVYTYFWTNKYGD